MIRAVVDTNVLIRFLIRPGAATRAMIEEWWVGGAFLMVSSSALIAELEEVLARPRIQALVSPDNAEVLLTVIREHAELIDDPDVVPSYTRDPKDDKFVACAIAGRADYLVTEDQDLLVLGTLMEVRMITSYAFVAVLGAAPEREDEEDE